MASLTLLRPCRRAGQCDLCAWEPLVAQELNLAGGEASPRLDRGRSYTVNVPVVGFRWPLQSRDCVDVRSEESGIEDCLLC